MKKVIIIGAGIGGLCMAIRLLKRGYDVTVIEKENVIGGRISAKLVGNEYFDMSGSILMNKEIYTEIFDDAGVNYNDYIEINDIETLYRVFYKDGVEYDFCKDYNCMKQTLEHIENGSSKDYFSLINSSYRKYKILRKKILNKKFDNIIDIVKNDSIRTAINLSMFKSSYKYISEYIKNEKILNYLLFQTMYIGVNPYKSSNIYTLIPAITQIDGLIYIDGGVNSYIKALEKIIYQLKGIIKKGVAVNKIIISNNKVVGVSTNNEFIEADMVVCNADFSYALENLFDKQLEEGFYKSSNICKKKQSISVFIVYLELNKYFDSLKTHNIYMAENFRESIESAFNGCIPKELSLYIYNQKRDNKSILNIMLRVPNLSANIKWTEKFKDSLYKKVLKTIKNIRGLESIEKYIIAKEFMCPVDFEKRFNSYKGNAFALAQTLNQNAYLRPSMKSKSTKGLYFVGGSVHPGCGISVIIESTKLLTNIIEKDNK